MTRRTAQQFLFGTLAGTITIFTSSALVLILACAGFLTVAEELSITSGLTEERSTFQSKIWESYSLFIDPGTQTGVESAGHHSFHLFVVVLFSLAGFVWVLLAFGVFIEYLSQVMEMLKRKYTRIAARDHILVLGWTGKTLFLIRELAQMLTDGPDRGGTICLFGDFDPFEMREEVAVAYRDFRSRWPRVKLMYWRGKTHEVDDLERVSVASARHILLLGASREPRVADSLVLSSLCALQCLPRAPVADVIVEIALPQNVGVARKLGGAASRTITAKTAIDELVAYVCFEPPLSAFAAISAISAALMPPTLSPSLRFLLLCSIERRLSRPAVSMSRSCACRLSMRSTAVGRSMMNLMSFEGTQFELVGAERLVAEAQAAGSACTFGAVRWRFRCGVCVGVSRRPSLTEGVAITELAPPDSFLLQPTDLLVVIANDFKDANQLYSFQQLQSIMLDEESMIRCGGASRASSSSSVRSGSRSILRPSRLLQSLTATLKSPPSSARNMAPFTPPPSPPGGGDAAGSGAAAHPPPGSSTTDSPFASRPAAARPPLNAYLLVGWVNGLESLLRAIDRRVPAGSEIYLLSEKPREWRRVELANAGLRLNGTSLGALMGSSRHASASSAALTSDGSSNSDGGADESEEMRKLGRGSLPSSGGGGGGEGEGLSNLRLHHIVGFPTDESALRRLPLHRAAAAIVSADVDTEDVDTQITDSEVIASAHLLMSIFRARGLRELRRTGVRRPPLRLLVEFNDVLTKRLLERRPGLVQPQEGEEEEEEEEEERQQEGEEEKEYDHAEGQEDGGVRYGRGEQGAAKGLGGAKISGTWIEVLPFHRQYLETSALSISCNSHEGWVILRRLFDAGGGVDVRDVRLEKILKPHELLGGDGSGGGNGDGNGNGNGDDGGSGGGGDGGNGGGPPGFSFLELSRRVSELEAQTRGSNGVLIGWQRAGEEPCLNPPDMGVPLQWRGTDRLLVVRPIQTTNPGFAQRSTLPRAHASSSWSRRVVAQGSDSRSRI